MAYNPGTQYRGDMYLFQGISGAGDAVGRGLERRKQERQEFDALAKYAEAAGYGTKDDTTPMSLAELKGFVRGMEAKAIADERTTDNKRQGDLVAAQVKNLEEDNTRAQNAVKAEQDRRQRTKDLYSTLARQAEQVGPNPDGSTQGDMTWEAIVNAAVQSNFDGSPLELKQLADGIRMGKTRNQEDLGLVQFDEDPVTGARFARRGGVVVPSGTNPAKQETKPEPMHGPNGELIGYVVRSPRGGVQMVKPPPEATIEVDVDPENPGSAKARMTVREYERRFNKPLGKAAPAGGPSNDPLGLFE